MGVIAFVLLAPLMFYSYLWGGHWRHHSSSSSCTAARIPDEDGNVHAALLHLTNDGKFHWWYPESLLTLFCPFNLF